MSISLAKSIALLLLFLISDYLYIPLNRRRSRFYWKSPIDKKIPLVPLFVVPYYFYLFYHPQAIVLIFLLSGTIFKRILAAFIVANFTAALFWYFFPNGVKRPRLRRKGFFFTMVEDLYRHDRYDTNAFPSNHVYGSIICSFYLAQALPFLAPVFFSIGFLITVSTVLVKQHNFFDLIAGVYWAASAIFFVSLLI